MLIVDVVDKYAVATPGSLNKQNILVQHNEIED